MKFIQQLRQSRHPIPGVIWKHALVWGLFILYETSYLSLATVKRSGFMDYALHYLVNIALFYFNAAGFGFIFGSRFNRFAGVVILILTEVIIYLLIEDLLTLIFTSVNAHYEELFTTRIKLIVQVYRAIYFIGLSVGYWFALSDARQRKLNYELENVRLIREKESKEKDNQLMHAQNAYLQSQLNPHLLFNSLNFIYNAVRKMSEPAGKAVILLSDMMRYSLSEAGINGRVPLSREIDHVKNLVRLNQLRFNEALQVDFSATGDFGRAVVIPLLLMSFIENLYKHGDLSDPREPARITLTYTDPILEMELRNKKRQSGPKEGWGIGIENSRSRLQSFYPDKFELVINESDQLYQVHLAIVLSP